MTGALASLSSNFTGPRADGAAQLGVEGELVLPCVSLHDGVPGPQLGHDAARPPHVHRRPVVPLAH